MFLLIFVWAWIYVSIQSFVLILWALHGLNERNHKRYLEMMAKIYFPFLYFAMMIMYITNIEGVFPGDCFDSKKLKVCRFGVYTFSIPFLHFLLQYSIALICFATVSFDLMLRERIKSAKISNQQLINQIKQIIKGNRKRAESKFYNEILLSFIIYYLDVLLMIALYYAGTYRYDVYHGLLLISFILFLLWPDKFRKNYIYLVIFIHAIVISKYIYALSYDIYSDKVDNILEKLGVSTHLHKKGETKYANSTLTNNNWLIVLLSSIQYRIYNSKYYNENLSDEPRKKKIEEFKQGRPT